MVEYPQYMARQAAFIESHGAPYLMTCARAIEAGLIRDWTTMFTIEDWALCPAFLPVFHSDFDYLYGAWITDPRTGELEVISILRDYPAFTGASLGATGLRALVNLLYELATALESDAASRAAALVNFAFPSQAPAARQALVAAVMERYAPDEDDVVRALPIVHDLWSNREATARAHAQPLPEIFARNEGGACTAEDFARPPSRRPAFEQALAGGDVASAWALLNRSGWAYEDVLYAVHALGPSMTADVRALLDAKLHTEVFAPTEGY